MRIKFDCNSEVLFETIIEVRITDINYGNHLGNDRVLSIAHEARMKFFKSLGYKDELNFGENKGIIVTDAAIMFINEAFHGDELRATLSVDDVTSKGMDVYHRLINSDTDKEIARVKTGILFFDYSTRKVGNIPVGFRKKLENLLK